jgi:hypothetical protein
LIDSTDASSTSLASDSVRYVAWREGDATHVYNAGGKVVASFPSRCSVLDLRAGDALLSCGSRGLGRIEDLASGQLHSLPSGMTPFSFGRFWVLAQRRVPSASDPMEQWLWINRATHRVRAVGPPFDIRGAGGDDPPLRERMDVRDLSLPVDPPWIPANVYLIERHGPRALTYTGVSAAGFLGLALQRSGRPAIALSACMGGCRDPSLGAGVAVWRETVRRRDVIRAYDGARVLRLRPPFLKNAQIIDLAHAGHRVFILYQPAGSTRTRLRSFAIRH